MRYRILRSLILAAGLQAAACLMIGLIADQPVQGISIQAQTVTTVNAASYATDHIVGAGSIVAGFGSFTTQNNQVYTAPGLPLPTTLGGVSVTVNGVAAELFFTSTGQINYVIPPATPVGARTVVVTNSNGTTVNGSVTVNATAPGLFSAKATGSGTAAALTTFDGITYQTVFDGSGNEVSVAAGTTANPNFLILYATSVRNAAATNPNDGNGVAESCKVTIQGVPCIVDYAGPAPGFVGLDQLNVRIPPELSGFGSLNVQLTITSATPNPLSNIVTIRIGGNLPTITTTRINPGNTVNGALTIADQIEIDQNTRETYFFDAYRFTATTNQAVAIDLRSSEMDAAIILYRIENDNSLTFIASDDVSGGFSYGQMVNNNAMLIHVPVDSADYIIFATTSDTQPDGVGNYTITLIGNAAQSLPYGTTLNSASITTSDIQISPGDYWDAYWFDGTQGDQVQITMTSAFNAYLVLNKNNGDYVVDDDNSGGGTNARISPTSSPRPLASLPTTGRYVIIATPYQPNVTGAYTISIAKTNAPAEGIQAVESLLPPSPSGRTGLADFYQRRGSNFERFARRRVINQ